MGHYASEMRHEGEAKQLSESIDRLEDILHYIPNDLSPKIRELLFELEKRYIPFKKHDEKIQLKIDRKEREIKDLIEQLYIQGEPHD